MKVLDQGHIYALRQLDSEEYQTLIFVNRGIASSKKYPGVQNQEVLRALIDRVIYLNNEKHWEGNTLIIKHLRLALILHEARALYIKVDKEKLNPEDIEIDKDGHFKLVKD